MTNPLRYALVFILGLLFLPLLGFALVLALAAPPYLSVTALVMLGLFSAWFILRRRRSAAAPVGETGLLPSSSSKGGLL